LALAAIFYVVAGALHFIKTDAYLKIVPPYIPARLVMVWISGGCEILGGLGLLLPQTRRAAVWALIALLIAVFPANVYMATNPIEAGAASIAPILRWGRLPLQLILAWWLMWCTKPQAHLKNALCGAVPRTAADAPVGSRIMDGPDQGSGADEGVRPT
jgi:uncharacterized membrane protein